MAMIFDRDGNELAEIPLSEKNQHVLDHDEEVVIIYHTLRAYADLQRASNVAREQH